MNIIGVSSFLKFIIIFAIAILAFVLYIFMLSRSYKRKRKKEDRELEIRVKKEACRFDVMDRVKPGEIELDRKNLE